MKRTMRKNLLRAITGSLGRFFSIFLIVALGCGFFAGIKATGADMRESADHYFDDTNLMDLHLMAELGFSQANVDAIAATKGVSGVMPTFQTILSTQHNGENETIRVQSYEAGTSDQNLNQLTVVAGRLPQNNSECVIDNKAITHGTYVIGQTITFKNVSSSTLKGDTYTVVGAVNSPKIVSIMASASSLGKQEPDYNVYMPYTSFSGDIYTDVYVTISGTKDLLCYTSAYSSRVKDVLTAIRLTGEGQSDARRTDVISLQTADLTQKLSGDQTKLTAALLPLNEITNQWYYLDRSTNTGYTSLKDDSERIDAISTVFPVFFFVVAALVSLTTMTRMVDEERMHIGSLKSLGYSRLAIAMKYTSYAAIASASGGAAGLLIGFQLFPRVIFNAYLILYSLPPIHPPFRPDIAWVTLLIAVFCTAVSTLFAILTSLRSTPAMLMRPKSPKIGKRVLLEKIPFIWNHMGFIKKVTARNLLRYKKRFLMTVIGIAGCTALILSGFGLKNSVTGLVDKQYGDIMRYDLQVMLQTPVKDPANDKTFTWISQSPETSSMMPVCADSVQVVSAKAKKDFGATLLISMAKDNFGSFISLHERVSRKVLPLTDDGVIITEKLARMKHVGTGDEITLDGVNNQSVQVKVTGICENYTFHYVYMTPTLYQKLYATAPEANAAFVILSDSSASVIEKFKDKMMNEPNIAGTLFIPLLKGDLGKVFVSLDYVVLVLIMSAFALAVVVLYNLTNININERVREIATLKVLGFYDKEVSAYVFRENAIITLIGAVLGLGLGTILHTYIIQTAEIDTMMFRQDILLSSFVISFALTILFSLLVNLVMHFYLKQINMVESLKSVE